MIVLRLGEGGGNFPVLKFGAMLFLDHELRVESSISGQAHQVGNPGRPDPITELDTKKNSDPENSNLSADRYPTVKMRPSG